jgi:hypothetical protein
VEDEGVRLRFPEPARGRAKHGKSDEGFPSFAIGVAGVARLQPVLQRVPAGVPSSIEISSDEEEDLGKNQNSLSIIISIPDT